MEKSSQYLGELLHFLVSSHMLILLYKMHYLKKSYALSSKIVRCNITRLLYVKINFDKADIIFSEHI